MMITEHNYEEYFLLYIDNELNASERKAVEDFVKQNPQHNALFSSLQDTKLPLDESLSFYSKEELYKDGTSEIGINNYEEYFLLYTDNELNKQEKEITERFVLQHPQLQEEFVLLQQTKLTPELIEYKNKEELYRKERRVILMFIAGLSVAASVFSVLFFSGILVSPQHQDGNLAATVVNTTDESTHQSAKITTSPKDIVEQPKEQKQTDLLADQTIKKGSEKRDDVAIAEQHSRTSEEQLIPVIHQSHQDEVAISPVPEERLTNQASLSDNNITAKQVSVLKPLQDDDEQTNTTTALSLSDNNTAQPAVYKELNTDDDEHTLYVSGLPINKNKVNGILKSASRLLGGRTKENGE